jgi:hypothetical protein
MYKAARANEKLFAQLREQWSGVLASYNESPEDFAVPYLDHAQKIAGEKPQSKKYGIFALVDEEGTFHGLYHANIADLPKTVGKTLRLNWILYSPHYEFQNVTDTDLAKLVSSIIASGLVLCKEWKANHMKVRLSNKAERTFAHGFTTLLRDKDLKGTLVEVRGNWLHLDNLKTE